MMEFIQGLEPIAPLPWYLEVLGMLALIGLTTLIIELLNL